MSNLKTERSFCFVFLVCSSECLYHHTGIGTCVSALWLIKGILVFFTSVSFVAALRLSTFLSHIVWENNLI